MRKNIREVENLLRARTDCIWVQTYEEKVFIDDLRELLSRTTQLKLELIQWSNTEGTKTLSLINSPNVRQETADSKFREYMAVFSRIRTEQEEKDGKSYAWILRDLHTVITEAKCQRCIRDLKEYRSLHYNPIIVVSPLSSIPDSVAKLFRIVEYDLPDKEEILKTVESANETIGKIAKTSPEKNYQKADEAMVQRIANAMVGLTLKEVESSLKECIVKFHRIDLDYLSRNKIEAVKKTGVLDYRIPKISINDIGGNDAIKEWLSETMEAFTPEAVEFGLDKPKGFMAVGIPGSGKTALAEALANEMGVPLLEFSMDKVMDKMVGQSEQKTAHALAIAKSCAPCVLLLDEAEKMLGAGAMSSNASDGGVTARIMSALLKFMDSNDSGIYVVMTSNDISQLPPEFTRTGRLDAIWYFGLPTNEERRKIFQIHFAKKNRDVGDIVLNEAARISEGFTGAEIQQVVKNAMMKAFLRYRRDGNQGITVADVRAAASEVIPVSKSSKEKILALDNYCKTRARSTSYTVKKDETNTEEDDAGGFLLDLV